MRQAPDFAGLFDACDKAKGGCEARVAEMIALRDEPQKSAASSPSARRRVPVSLRIGKVRGLVFYLPRIPESPEIIVSNPPPPAR